MEESVQEECSISTTKISNDTLICPICLYECFLPVEIICFVCTTTQKFGCHSLHRFCLRCAINLLQLNLPSDMRTPEIRCLFCPTIVRSETLTFGNAFRIDYMEISRNDGEAQVECPFCYDQMVYTHLARHLLQKCPFYWNDCVCGSIYIRCNEFFHRRSCPSFDACHVCQEIILKTEMDAHLLHDHDVRRCDGCHLYVMRSMMTNHLKHECPKRVIACKFCTTYTTGDKILRHLEKHVRECRSKARDLGQQLDVIEKDMETIMNEWKHLSDTQKNQSSFLRLENNYASSYIVRSRAWLF